ncbi:histidine kinase [Sphingomonas lenta]|uniref:Histidine kinase n=2 Tax=Sphingomonas lenta TaxID=1141887 RepID=A0A2A2SGI6_9SPHN|nr:histidine kinase [Sphingomonas lenta]
MLEGPGVPAFDFARPPGEPALVDARSVSWRVFRNPVALFTGGVAAVILELAEPAVRAGVWDHSSFRTDPVGRLRRTGLAAMATVYGARSAAEAMIAGVRRAHERVTGVTAAGLPYRADDPELLRWVQATAVWGFAGAYHAYAAPLAPPDLSRAFAEGAPAARLYGVPDPPRSLADWEALLARAAPRLEPSPVLGEFLGLMRGAPVLPRPLRPVQRLMVRGAVALVPEPLRAHLRLGRGFRASEAALLRRFGALAERVDFPSGPPARALRRLGLPPDFFTAARSPNAARSPTPAPPA